MVVLDLCGLGTRRIGPISTIFTTAVALKEIFICVDFERNRMLIKHVMSVSVIQNIKDQKEWSFI